MREARVWDGACCEENREQQIEHLRCPIISEKTIIRLRYGSLRKRLWSGGEWSWKSTENFPQSHREGIHCRWWKAQLHTVRCHFLDLKPAGNTADSFLFNNKNKQFINKQFSSCCILIKVLQGPDWCAEMWHRLSEPVSRSPQLN